MCLTAKHFGLQEENINISKPQGNAKTGWGTTEREERQMERKREKRMQCFMKKEDKSLIAAVAELVKAWDTLTMFEATVCGRS